MGLLISALLDKTLGLGTTLEDKGYRYKFLLFKSFLCPSVMHSERHKCERSKQCELVSEFLLPDGGGGLTSTDGSATSFILTALPRKLHEHTSPGHKLPPINLLHTVNMLHVWKGQQPTPTCILLEEWR